MSKDIFSIDPFEETGISNENGDIFDANINEAADVSIPVPGGLSGTPSAKPYDAASIPIPNKTTITADEYNSTLDALKKSFKEASDVMTALQEMKIVDKTPEQCQEEYTEACLEEALMESYMNGPLFEAAKDDKKDDIKKAVKTIGKKIKQSRSNNEENPYNLRESTWLARILGGNKEAGRNAWKTVGTFTAKKSDFKKAISSFTSTYKEDLGELFFNADLICDFDELSKADNLKEKDKKNIEDTAKNVGDSYVLFIDSTKKETPSTLKLHGLNAAKKRLK